MEGTIWEMFTSGAGAGKSASMWDYIITPGDECNHGINLGSIRTAAPLYDRTCGLGRVAPREARGAVRMQIFESEGTSVSHEV